MQTCEGPVFRELFAGRRGLNVLDVGCNDGEKTVRWFTDPAVARVLGLEYNAALARRAHEVHGGEVFSFYPCDVEAEEFPVWMAETMDREGLDGFDVIYLSFVLSHLKAPERLLRRLRALLRPGGALVAVETDDGRSYLRPQGGELLEAFLELLTRDPYAGDRSTGSRLPKLLRDSGFDAVRLCCDAISAGPGERARKEDIFEMFFSYLPEDVPTLRAEAPEAPDWGQMERWLAENLAQLKHIILADNSEISMGMAVVVSENNPCRSERSAET